MAFLVGLLGGCGFAPDVADRYACGEGGACPPGLVCAQDRICREQTDGGIDGAVPQSLAVDLAVSAPVDLAVSAPVDLATPISPDASMPVCVRAMCTDGRCGELPDGCGGVLVCKGCGGDRICGGSGTNICGKNPCQPKTCATLGNPCGLVSDGCALVLNCGACP